MATKTPAKKTAPPVPDLAPTPALEIDSDDVQLPKLYVAHYQTKAVQDDLVKPGQIFAATGPDDSDPVVVYDGSDKAEGVLIHVLSLVKGKSCEVDGELTTWAFNDPDAPPEAWTTYKYVVVVPEVDPDVPHTFLMTRSGKPAAQKINTVLKKNEARGPAYISAFRVTTAKRENEKGRWFVPQVKVVEANDEHLQIASSLADMVGSAPAQVTSGAAGGSDDPAI